MADLYKARTQFTVTGNMEPLQAAALFSTIVSLIRIFTQERDEEYSTACLSHFSESFYAGFSPVQRINQWFDIANPQHY